MPRPPGFVPWAHTSPLLDGIGGFEAHESDPSRFGFTVEESKVNSRGFLHAGVIPAIADVAIGHRLAALVRARGRDVRFVTIELSCSYIGIARLGDWVEGQITPLKVGRRIAVGSAVLGVGQPVASVKALFVPAPDTGRPA